MEWNWLTGSVAITAIVSAFSYIKATFRTLVSVVVVSHPIDSDLQKALVAYLSSDRSKARSLPVGTFEYMANRYLMRMSSLYHWQVVGYCNLTVYVYRYAPLLITGRSTLGNKETGPAVIVAARGTVNLKQLFKETTEFITDRERSTVFGSRFRVNTFQGRNKNVMQTDNGSPQVASHVGSIGCSAFNVYDVPMTCGFEDVGISDTTFVDVDQLELGDDIRDFISLAEKWIDSRAYYMERRIPWKLGAIFHGAPGTGKTSLVRALASKLNIPICVFDLQTMDNRELRSFWDEARGMTPAIILLEDIDCVFSRREPVNEGIGVTFDALLQCLSGADEPSGIIFIVTTNNRDAVDPALTRPGRADHDLYFDYLKRDGAKHIAQRILADWPDEIDAFVEYVFGIYSGKVTGSAMQTECVDYAIRKLKEAQLNGKKIETPAI